MKSLCRVLVMGGAILMLAPPFTITAQWTRKPYTEWSEKEALKLLNDSPWAQTQTVTDTSKQSSTTRSGSGSTTAIADIVSINFRVRFFSAKPTRQAIARFMELQQKGRLPEPNSDIPNRDASGRTASSIGFTINTRYKVKDMMFNGKLEY